MEGKKPQFVFYRPNILDLEEEIIPLRVHSRLDYLENMPEDHAPHVIFAPAGIGISCGRTALMICEEAIMIVICHKPALSLDETFFNLSELIKRPRNLEAITAIERLMMDDSLQPLIIPIMSQERFNYETFINLEVVRNRFQKPFKLLNKVFNNHSRQKIRYFMRKQ